MTPSGPSRARITAGELVIVCSYFDLGQIEEVRKFRGGSRLAPKVYIRTQWGEFLLKRRAPGPSNEPSKVAFTHEVMLHLAASGFPVPPPIGTKVGNNSMLQLGPGTPGGGGVYELFRFVQGVRYDRTPESAWAAGWWLARCHAILEPLKPLFPAPRRTFHAHPKVPERLGSISGTLQDPGLRPVCRELSEAYRQAAEQADRFASNLGEEQIVHGDWHPGNMLFRSPAVVADPNMGAAGLGIPPAAKRVAAVFDFDSARMGQPLHDFANGAMQFAVHRHLGESTSGEHIPPSSWRIALDPDLLRGFCDGYQQGATATQQGSHPGRGAFSAGVMKALPWLMIEALIVEAGVPIASTGKFGKLDAKPMLGVVQRAVQALAGGADKIVSIAAGT